MPFGGMVIQVGPIISDRTHTATLTLPQMTGQPGPVQFVPGIEGQHLTWKAVLSS